MNPIDIVANGPGRGMAAGARIHPKVRKQPAKPPEMLDVPWNEVRPFDHTEEGRVVMVMLWQTEHPAKLLITTATPEVVHPPEPEFLDLWEIVWHDQATTEHDATELVRVIRGIPLGPPR